MSTPTQRILQGKRAELVFERVQLAKRLAEVEEEVAALDYAIGVIEPGWKPPQRISKPCAPTRLPRGAVAQSCLLYLRSHGELWTRELAKLISDRYRLAFTSTRDEQDFASGVAMALRRYERQGLLEVVGKDDRTSALKWRLRLGPDGRLALVPKVA